MPVYFVSKTLTSSEVNYSPIEKLVYALVHTARRLRRYFQAHPIVVLTDQPIKQVLYKPEISGRMAKWAVELGEHEINFSSRSAVKGQILADYLAEIPADVEASAEHQDPPAPVLSPWELYTDGACSASGAGAGVILTGPGGEEHTYALRFNFAVTNNEAEYEALLAGMRIAHKLNVKILHAYVDSKLVCNQVCGDFEAHDIAMQQYLSLVHNLADQFEAFQISHVMRGQNKKADALSKLAALAFDHMARPVARGTLQGRFAARMQIAPQHFLRRTGKVGGGWQHGSCLAEEVM
ncbi:uncharacterized protein [Rutidosis leptorrhynchoides]|uniref:uncharacterized protein n=1 Tax=Rutidosis leptorrhynchoides TaxID=125765 RepID=UPI003A9A629B